MPNVRRGRKFGAGSEANAVVSGFDGISGGKENPGNSSSAEVILLCIDFSTTLRPFLVEEALWVLSTLQNL